MTEGRLHKLCSLTGISKRCLVMLMFALYPCGAGAVGANDLLVAVGKVQLHGDQLIEVGSEQRFLADVIGDILGKAVQSEFGRITQYTRAPRYVDVRRLREEISWSDEEFTEAWYRFREAGASIGVLSNIRFAEQGSFLKIYALDLRDDRETVHSEVVVLGNQVDFGDIERELTKTTMSLAESLSRRETSSAMRVLLWCVRPTGETSEAGVRLTLELPYSLTALARERSLDYDFIGLNSRDYYVECGSLGRPQPPMMQNSPFEKDYLQFDQYDFILSGDVTKKGRRLLINLVVDSGSSRFAVPLTPFDAASSLDQAAMQNLADEILSVLPEATAGLGRTPAPPSGLIVQ